MSKLLLIIAILYSGNVFSQNDKEYRIVNKIHLSGNEKWDFLHSDDATNRLYVSHGNKVQVIDEAKGALIGEITGLNGVHGITIANNSKGYITNGKENAVVVFDTQSLKTITAIEVGKKPDDILFDPHSKKIFVFNGHSNDCSVIDPVSDKVISTISLGGKPEISVSDEKGKIYVNLEDISAVAVINASSYKVETVWPIAPGEEPTGIALDRKKHLLFSSCANNTLVVVDARNGKVLQHFPIGGDPDGAVFDPDSKRVFSSNGEGSLTILQEDNNGKCSLLTEMKTQTGAKTIAFNKLTHHIYLTTADFEHYEEEDELIVPDAFVVIDITNQ